jgi:hypothetical protein
MRMIREFIELSDHIPLEEMIGRLATVRDQLPAGSHGAEVRMTGDDVFGRKLSITYLRPQTPQEAARDERYATAHRHSRIRQLIELQAEVDADNRAGADLSIAA